MLKKIILITGSNGEIGQYLIKELNKKNINNIIAIDLHPLNIKYKIEQYFKGSILDQQLLKKIQEQYIVTEIYHLAAILSTKAEQNIELANNVNINGTKNILELATAHSKQYNIKTIGITRWSYHMDVKDFSHMNIIDKPIQLYGDMNINSNYHHMKEKLERVNNILRNSKPDYLYRNLLEIRDI